eukprot:gene6209-27697_t
MYCIKCKSKTGGTQPQQKTVNGNRHMLVSTCAKCGTKKCQFVSSKKNQRLKAEEQSPRDSSTIPADSPTHADASAELTSKDAVLRLLEQPATTPDT